jgi:FkbM family methyltransferase
VRSFLRSLRRLQARLASSLIARFPGLEPPFISAGRWLTRRSRRLGTLYWFSEDDLVHRLRRSGNRFRRLPVAGIDTFVDVTDGSARLHYFHDEPYEPQLAAAVRDLLKPGDVFVDAGANIGFFSILAARIVGPSGRVFAFEPHPEALATFRDAIAVNGVIVEVVHAAVGSSVGTIDLFLSQDPVLSTTDPARSPARDHFSFDRRVSVPLLTLDAWLARHPEVAPRLALVKIDVEGTEADVLDGMRDVRAACPRAAIVLETDRDGAADAILVREGYERRPLDARREAFGNYLYVRRTLTMC